MAILWFLSTQMQGIKYLHILMDEEAYSQQTFSLTTTTDLANLQHEYWRFVGSIVMTNTKVR